MSIKTQILKTRPICKVTLRVNKEAARGAADIFVVGDFNGWTPQATPMKQLKSGDFTCTLELPTDRDEYQFRYLHDDGHWDNDWEASRYAPNGLGTENTVICLEA